VTTHTERFLGETSKIAMEIDHGAIERIVNGLVNLRNRFGRLFILGVGGSAANSGHAVNDFRKLAGIEAYAPTDNVSELTARTNDEGWETVFEAWLKTSRINQNDVILVLSVGGGDIENGVSVNIVKALEEGKRCGATIYGIVGRSDGFTHQVGDEVVVVPNVNSEHVTPHSESFQSIVWHCLVFHPDLKVNPSKWESIIP